MKKVWHVLLMVVCCLCFGLAACGGKTETAITLSKEALTLKVGGSETLEATLAEGASFTAEELVWTSSDESVVSVTGEGATATVTALAVGTATVTVSFGEDKAECAVTVEESENKTNPLSIFLPEGKLILKPNVTASVKAMSETALTGEPVWTSSDPTIGTVEGQGLTARVTSLKRGECTITVACDGFTASFTLVVGIS